MKSLNEIDRRHWLRNASLGVIGGGLMSSMAHAQQPEEEKHNERRKRFLEGDCPQVLKVSKHLTGPMRLFPPKECPCKCVINGKTQIVYRVDYKSILKFGSNQPCDETELEPLLQSGFELWLEGTLTLRLDTCRETSNSILIGRNQAQYRIHRYRPNEDVMIGQFCGTEGVLPTEMGGKRCCVPNHGLGSFCGEGIGKLRSWSLCVSYHSITHGLTPESLCDPHEIKIEMDMDGVLIGPCKPIGPDNDDKKK